MAAITPIPATKSAEVAMEQLLNSRTFQKAATQRKLLQYLWERRDHDVSEYAIALDALGRPATFDPRVDATVRVQVSRLRQRLKEFYEDEGKEAGIRFLVPVGSHSLDFVVESADTASLVALPPPTRFPYPSPLRLLIGAVCTLSVLCGGLLWERVHDRGPVSVSGATPVPALPEFWQKFLSHGNATQIVVPSPIFFEFGSNIRVRDFKVNDFTRYRESAVLARLAKQYGEPSLAQDYIVASDALASFQLQRLLERGRQEVSIMTTADWGVDGIEKQNHIVLGTTATLTPLHRYLDQLNFWLSWDQSYILNRHPRPGEPARFARVSESNDHQISLCIVAVLPTDGGRSDLMLIITRRTSAVVSYLTSTAGVAELQQRLSHLGNPRYFEAVMLSEVTGEKALHTWPASLRKFEGAR